MIKCVLFDLDGTLLDDEEFTISSKIIEGKKYGYEVHEEDVKASLGMSKDASYKHFTSLYGKDFPVKILREARKKYIVDFFKENGLRLKPYVNEILEYLKKNKIKTAICTSSSRELIDEYRKYGDLFSEVNLIVSGDEIKRGKPEPDIFLSAAEKLGFSPDECLVVEDANTGVEAALKAKMDVIMIPDLVEPLEKFVNYVKIYKDLSYVISYLEQTNNKDN